MRISAPVVCDVLFIDHFAFFICHFSFTILLEVPITIQNG